MFDSYDFASSVYSVSNIEEVLSYLLLGYRTPPGGGGGGGLGYSPIWPIRECAAAAGQGIFFTSLS